MKLFYNLGPRDHALCLLANMSDYSLSFQHDNYLRNLMYIVQELIVSLRYWAKGDTLA